MFKNSVIAMLIGIIYFMWIGEFSLSAYICMVTIITFAVWGAEDFIQETKRKLVFKRRIQKKIAHTKISQAPTKAS